MVGLGKPLALHSIFKPWSALTVTSFGSDIQLKGTIFAILFNKNFIQVINIKISTFYRK